jgi:hypothetical protein
LEWPEKQGAKERKIRSVSEHLAGHRVFTRLWAPAPDVVQKGAIDKKMMDTDATACICTLLYEVSLDAAMRVVCPYAEIRTVNQSST